MAHRQQEQGEEGEDMAEPPPNMSQRRTSRRLLMPHGSYALVIATVSTLGWLAALFQDGCDFARVEGSVIKHLETEGAGGGNSPPWLEFGLSAYREPIQNSNGDWETSFDTVCLLYPEDLMDDSWTTARTFAFLALVIGGGGTMFLWCSTCFVFSKGTWRWTGYELLLASLCQAIAFCWFATQVCDWNTCTLFWGSKADIAASVLWFFCGLLVICRYPNPIDLEAPDGNASDDVSSHSLDPEATNSPGISSNDDVTHDDQEPVLSSPNAQIV